MNFQEIKKDSVLPEIQYYISFCLLKRLFEQGKITLASCQKANAAIAEKYGVLSYQRETPKDSENRRTFH